MHFAISLVLIAAVITGTSYTVAVSAIPYGSTESCDSTSSYNPDRWSTGTDNLLEVSPYCSHQNNLIKRTDWKDFMDAANNLEHLDDRDYTHLMAKMKDVAQKPERPGDDQDMWQVINVVKKLPEDSIFRLAFEDRFAIRWYPRRGFYHAGRL
ncbi:hypothetical protein BC835DRAFT_1385224 [Cytidiella melzeri]|nr:hypothetical protein BC835DRAFT_1385224 [Cytidiella melzeri]